MKKKPKTPEEKVLEYLDNYCELLDGLKVNRCEIYKKYANEKINRIKEDMKFLEAE
jgi:hypothetical protein